MSQLLPIGKFALFKNGIKNTKKSNDIFIWTAVKAIRSEHYRDKVEKIRTSDDKSVRSVIKSTLDYFCFSGTFKERNVEGLLKHSGIICIDFDLNGEHPDPEDRTQKVHITEYHIESVKYQLSKDPHTLATFVSPSGDGIKVLVKIFPDLHLESFNALKAYYLKNFGLSLDESGKDVSRACYASYDPEIFYNQDSQIFQVEGIEEKVSPLPAPDPKFRIDTETGEVIEVNDFEGWDRKKKEEFDRITVICGRIFQKKVDITSQYDDWLSIGMSLAIYGEHGRDLYHKVSQFNSKYNEPDCNYKFSNLIKTSNFTSPAKFIKICKEYDIDVKVARTIPAGIAEGAEGKGYQDFTFQMPDDMPLTPEIKKHVFQYSFFEFNCRYYYAMFKNENRTVSFYNISNFVIRPLFLIMHKQEPMRIIEIENIFGVCKVVDIPAKAFVSLSEFKAFVEGSGNFLFDGDMTKFQKIKAKLYDLSRNAEEVRTLGYHRDGFYAFANGIYTDKFEATDDHGVIEYKERNYFIPALSSIYKDQEEDFEAQKKFLFIRNKISWQDWSTQFCAVHKDNGVFGLMYYLTSLFRDLVYDNFKFFPHLFLFGPPGSGKSQLGWSLMAMYGQAQAPFNLNGGTKVAFHKKFAMFRNALVWFDEYNNAIDYQRVQALKAAYDGTGHEKSEMTSANRTKTTPVNSGCLMSGQELPIADNALFKRCILAQYHQTEYTDAEVKAHNALREIEQKGLSHITGHLSTLRQKFKDEYFDINAKLLKEFKVLLEKENNIEERIIQNMVIIVATYKVLEPVLKFPFDFEKLKSLAISNIKNQNNLIANAKETNMFWDLVEFMIDKNEAKYSIDYKIELHSEIIVNLGRNEVKEIVFSEGNEKASKHVLFLRLQKIHGTYMELHRRQYNKNGLDKGSLIHYLQNNKGFLGNVYSTRFDNSKSSAMCFDYDYLKSQGINLERGDPDVHPPIETPDRPKPPAPVQMALDQVGRDEDMPF
jgi:hypothetical protein